MKLYLIVPVFLNTSLTEAFLRSLQPENFFERIIIVDDHPDRLHASFYKINEIDVIFGNGSLYWGGSINLGIKHLQENFDLQHSDFVIIANNDVTLNFNLSKFSEYISKNTNATYHVKVKDKNGNTVKSCGIIKTWFPFFQTYPKDFEDEMLMVDTLTARFLAIPYHIIKNIKGIDRRLLQYGGDSDFGLKVKAKGYKNYILRDFSCIVDFNQSGIISKATLLNIKSVLFNIKSSYNIKYRWIFVRNHMNPFFSAFVILSMYFKLFIILLSNTISRK